ncbi:MAG: aromatic amino acid hydroxylase [Acidobacteriota bacterium]
MTATTPPSIFEVEQIARLPRHLKRYIVEQNYHEYTPTDHAVWRYIMRQALDFHSRHAHEAYVEGLRRTGIGIEQIPRVEEMNEILGRIGWGAAPVDGFIPPAAFMEFQAHRVLVIAADIRQLQHIAYTPAPDIIHEAAGHAPIIADPEYAEYLRRFGEVGSRALSSRQDFELYEAIRRLSILKEAPETPPEATERAEREVEERQAGLGDPSEMARLSRLHWWTVEYGLVGDLAHPKLYGAGLLSSIGEAAHCLTPAVEKRTYSVAAADVAFDITTMQPQLFVTPDFRHLNAVLDEFAATMAFRRGGLEGLENALGSGSVATFEYSSGLQVSGVIGDVVTAGDRAVYVRTSGPTALAVGGHELAGHGKSTHADGFSSPVGRARGAESPLEHLDDAGLARLGLRRGSVSTLEFPGGIRLEGRLERTTRVEDRVVLLSFSGCLVRQGERVLFDPSWGSYDMAVGERIVSVFQGAADKDAFEEASPVVADRTIKVQADEQARRLAACLAEIRQIRESGRAFDRLAGIFREGWSDRVGGWLPALEILEILLAEGSDPALAREVRHGLEQRAAADTEVATLIENGLRLADREQPRAT